MAFGQTQNNASPEQLPKLSLSPEQSKQKQNLQAFMDGLSEQEKSTPEHKKFLRDLAEWDEKNNVEAIRTAGTKQTDNYMQRHKMLSRAFLNIEMGKEGYEATVNFGKNDLAYKRVGAADMLPPSVFAISIKNMNGEIVSQKAIRGVGKNGRIGFFDEKTREYVPVYSGDKITVLETWNESQSAMAGLAEQEAIFKHGAATETATEEVEKRFDNHPGNAAPLRDLFLSALGARLKLGREVNGAANSAQNTPKQAKSVERQKQLSYSEALQKIIKENPGFEARVAEIAKKVGCPPEALYKIMWKECRLDPRAINRISGASGLIQFMPETAIGLGTSVEAIRNMTAMQQLDFVEKYFKPHFGKLHNYGDVYLAVFYPYALGKGDDFVLGSEQGDKRAALVAKQNRGVDTDGDGVITKADFYKYAGGTPPSKNT